jgi:preprotein translocase subunit SecG
MRAVMLMVRGQRVNMEKFMITITVLMIVTGMSVAVIKRSQKRDTEQQNKEKEQ